MIVSLNHTNFGTNSPMVSEVFSFLRKYNIN